MLPFLSDCVRALLTSKLTREVNTCFRRTLKPERSMPSPLPDADLSRDGSIETPLDPSTTGQRGYLRNLLSALQLVRGGDFSVRMPGDRVGIEGKIADTF